ncbi:MAG: hypothetical protein WC516_06430 [Patescibacteria group bacterium]
MIGGSVSKEFYIKEIENYWPANSTDIDVADIGKQLLKKAKIYTECAESHRNWQDYPENVLCEYYQLCRQLSKVVYVKIFSFVDMCRNSISRQLI